MGAQHGEVAGVLAYLHGGIAVDHLKVRHGQLGPGVAFLGVVDEPDEIAAAGAADLGGSHGSVVEYHVVRHVYPHAAGVGEYLAGVDGKAAVALEDKAVLHVLHPAVGDEVGQGVGSLVFAVHLDGGPLLIEGLGQDGEALVHHDAVLSAEVKADPVFGVKCLVGHGGAPHEPVDVLEFVDVHGAGDDYASVMAPAVDVPEEAAAGVGLHALRGGDAGPGAAEGHVHHLGVAAPEHDGGLRLFGVYGLLIVGIVEAHALYAAAVPHAEGHEVVPRYGDGHGLFAFAFQVYAVCQLHRIVNEINAAGDVHHPGDGVRSVGGLYGLVEGFGGIGLARGVGAEVRDAGRQGACGQARHGQECEDQFFHNVVPCVFIC